MYLLTRTSSEPASPLKIMIAKPEGQDAGLSYGGSFVLEPGDSVQVDDYVAKAIMGDPGLAPHFNCVPPWKADVSHPADIKTVADPAHAEAENDDADQPKRPHARRY